jgi:hypothetical protein
MRGGEAFGVRRLVAAFVVGGARPRSGELSFAVRLDSRGRWERWLYDREDI